MLVQPSVAPWLMLSAYFSNIDISSTSETGMVLS
jgi:hypothetical protein